MDIRVPARAGPSPAGRLAVGARPANAAAYP